MMEWVNSTMIYCKNFYKCHNVPSVNNSMNNMITTEKIFNKDVGSKVRYPNFLELCNLSWYQWYSAFSLSQYDSDQKENVWKQRE
jgi:hypothetical protein